jgi:hypothetical protein
MTVTAEIVALCATLLNLPSFVSEHSVNNAILVHRCLFESCSDVAAATVRCRCMTFLLCVLDVVVLSDAAGSMTQEV